MEKWLKKYGSFHCVLNAQFDLVKTVVHAYGKDFAFTVKYVIRYKSGILVTDSIIAKLHLWGDIMVH